jgi:RNA polymerase sigma-70 factor (ECF subfamily)
MARIAAAMADLSERDREVIALVVWSGLTYEQAAAALGVPVGTVRSRLARARTRLAAAVQEDT